MLVVKTNSSESQPRKVELIHAHKKRNGYCATVSFLHITTELVNTPIKQPYCIEGLFKITTESIKLIPNVEQYGVGSN